VVDIVQELTRLGVKVHVHDPVAAPADAEREYGIELLSWDKLPESHAFIAAVAHDELVARPVNDYVGKLAKGGCFIDVKSKFDRTKLEAHGLSVWRL
jgi:UDP-N-acetyl-D-glucosamine/UDP-N-acetyl-D-galactosamine dehydrogenase